MCSVGTCTAGQQWTELCRTRSELQRRLKIKPIRHEWESQIGKKRPYFFQKLEWEYSWMLNRQLWHNPKIRRQEYYQVTTVKKWIYYWIYWIQSIGTNVTNEKLSSNVSSNLFSFCFVENIQRHHFN